MDDDQLFDRAADYMFAVNKLLKEVGAWITAGTLRDIHTKREALARQLAHEDAGVNGYVWAGVMAGEWIREVALALSDTEAGEDAEEFRHSR